MEPLKLLIVEDELNNILLIKEMLKKLDFPVEIVGTATEVYEAIEVIKNTKPQLVLLDIMIKGGTSFTILEKIENYTFEIIFITAYSQYAIDAIKKHALDYILKPINYAEFSNAMIHSRSRIKEKEKIKNIQPIEANSFFSVKTTTGSEVIPVDSILYFEADGSYTKCITEKNNAIVSKNIGDVEKELPSHVFFRCHHSYIINVNHIEKVELSRSGTIECTNGQVIFVSQRKKKEFMDFLQQNKRL